MKRLPDNFKYYDEDPIVSNIDLIVNKEVEKAIKGKPLVARYPAWNFFANVWWDEADSQWQCEIHIHGEFIETLTASSIEEIVIDASEKFGWE